jgi:hypothetical protein
MNGFLFSELSKKFLPDYYFVVDPAYWDSSNLEGVKLKNDLRAYLQSINPSCLFFQPANKNLLCPGHTNTLFIDGRVSAGLKRWSKPNRPWGLPSSVTMIAISTMKYIGFKTIYFAGLDSNSYLNFFVDDLNEVKYTSSNTYFFSQKVENVIDFYDHPNVQSMGDWPIRHMADVFYAAAIFMRDLKELADNRCINVGHDRTNDACPRASLLK